MIDLYNECHRLFSYDKSTGKITRRFTLTGKNGKPLPSEKCKEGAEVGTLCRGYLIVSVGRKTYMAHRIVWLMVHGEIPKNQIDHVNGDKSDNRIENLRQATPTQNSCNVGKRARNKSGFKGVSYEPKSKKNPFIAQIQVGGKKVYLGCFQTAEVAHGAYVKASAELHGTFARTE